MTEIGTVNKDTYDAVKGIVHFLTNPEHKQWLSTRPKSEVAMALFYVAEELALNQPEDVRREVAMLAYMAADELSSPYEP